MKNKKQGPVISDPGCEELLLSDSVPEQDACGTESRNAGKKTPAPADWLARLRSWFDSVRHLLLGDAADAGYAARVHTVRRLVRRAAAAAAVFGLSLLFSGAVLSYETCPLGLAFLCAAATPGMLAASALGLLLSQGEAAVLYLGGAIVSVGMRYAVGRYLTPDPEAFGAGHSRRARYAPRRGAYTAGGDAAVHPLVRLGRAVFPSGVFSQNIAARVGISVLAASPVAIGYLLGDTPLLPGGGETLPAVRALFVMAAIPVFTYLFCGVFDGRRCAPALREAGIGAVCYAVTVSMGGVMIFGFSLRQLCAHAITLYISQKHGYLRGALAGLVCGFGCDVLYAPAYALIGAASGLLWRMHTAAAVIGSCAVGAMYAVYVGAFAAVRTVLPEMIVVSAAAYPLLRYLPALPEKWGLSDADGGRNAASAREVPAALTDLPITPAMLGVPSLELQLDALSGILMGLSSTFYHLSDRTRKPGLYEIRQMCESISDRYCAQCPQHALCWERDFSATADAMGRITLCIHRRGRAENTGAFAPLDRVCPSLPNMLAAMNDAAAHLCEEKMTKDKTETAAGDYEGMAKLLRASAAAYAKSCERDDALSRRLGRAMHRIGFRAEAVSVYGDRRRVVVAQGLELGGDDLRAAGGGLLGSEELREAFSALSGVRYQSPEFHLTAGGAKLCMTMRAGPKLAVTGGVWGEKKADEEVSGDAVCLFANRSDCFYALVCDGMGSGREASVTAQISALFLEKLLSVSTAAGAALNLLNGFLRARSGECTATVDLCEIDMIVGEAKFIKCGAAASFILRGEQLFRIASGTTPLGILREVSAEETTAALCGGDLLLFFSDGVCGEEEDSAWITETVCAARAAYDARCAKQHIREAVLEDGETAEKQPTVLSLTDALALALGEAAAARTGRRDDMTVAVLNIREIA